MVKSSISQCWRVSALTTTPLKDCNSLNKYEEEEIMTKSGIYVDKAANSQHNQTRWVEIKHIAYDRVHGSLTGLLEQRGLAVPTNWTL